MGDLVKLLGLIAIIAIIFTVVAATFTYRSSVVSITPDWRERQAAGMER